MAAGCVVGKPVWDWAIRPAGAAMTVAIMAVTRSAVFIWSAPLRGGPEGTRRGSRPCCGVCLTKSVLHVGSRTHKEASATLVHCQGNGRVYQNPCHCKERGR